MVQDLDLIIWERVSRRLAGSDGIPANAEALWRLQTDAMGNLDDWQNVLCILPTVLPLCWRVNRIFIGTGKFLCE